MNIQITGISDCHGMWPEDFFMNYEHANGDILICCGDITNRGSVGEAIDWAVQWNEVAKNYKRTFLIPGNHDECFDTDAEKFENLADQMKAAMPNLEVFLGGSTHHQGIKFGFNPYVLRYGSYDFMTNEEGIFAKLQRLGRCDVFVSHGPSFGLLDQTRMVQAGSNTQRAYVDTHQPCAHLFGHIHESAGVMEYGKTFLMNAGIRNYPSPGLWEEHTFIVDSVTKDVSYGSDIALSCKTN